MDPRGYVNMDPRKLRCREWGLAGVIIKFSGHAGRRVDRSGRSHSGGSRPTPSEWGGPFEIAKGKESCESDE